MKIKQQPEETPLETNMTPMIDIIFQLLIFFMCSIHFKALEGKLMSYLPKDKGMKTSVATPQLNEITVDVEFDEATKTSKYFVGESTYTDVDQVIDVVQKVYDQFRDQPKPAPVKLRAQPKVPWRDVIAVVDGCKKRNITNVEFQAAPPPSTPN
ncbi:MAG: biopolymer transporter ExbD [Planctomycetes bacterium]|nr:biopolymer transporter ExbD [Planctomycetota bacterium]